MFRTVSPTVADPLSDQVEFTIHSTLMAHGHTLHQTQFATTRFVLTRTGNAHLLFAPDLGGRFIVASDRHELRRLDPSRQKPAPEQVRSLLGDVVVEEPPETFDIDGRRCRMIRITNRDARLVLAIECYCCRIDDLDRTALGAERAFDEAFQPFTLPLQPDELVAQSTTRALAADFEQSQVLRLVELETRIEPSVHLDEILNYPIVGD